MLIPGLIKSIGIQDFEAFRNDQTLGLSNKIRHILFEEHEPYYYPTVLGEQQQLLRDGYDLKILTRCFRAFAGLQEVHLLAIMVMKDVTLRNLASSYDTWDFTDCKWIPACKHAVETLTRAMKDAGSKVTAFCSPTMSPQSLTLLSPKYRAYARQAWSNLTYLEVTFDERPDRSFLDTSGTILTDHNDEVASMFGNFLRAAKNLHTLYIRFTPGMPVRLPLQDAFGDLTWPKLRVLGIGSWMLHGDELLQIFNRHGRTLIGLRLDEVYLIDGDRWRDVVEATKKALPNLEWVHLHDINYERQYIRKEALIETHSDTDNEHDDDLSDLDRLSIRSRDSRSSTTLSHHTYDYASPGGEDGEDEEGLLYGNVFTSTTSNSTSGDDDSIHGDHLVLFSGCQSPGESDIDDIQVLELEDDGRTVSQGQRRHWERWILGRTNSGKPYPWPL